MMRRHISSLIVLLGLLPFFNADTGVLQSAGQMNVPRAAQTATTLPDGRVLLAGGMTGMQREPVAGAEIYDPEAGRFEAAGSMVVPRHSHTATVLKDGKVLITGGYNAQGDYLYHAEVYDPQANGFSAVGKMQEARAGHVAVTLNDGRILLIGGVGEGWTFLSSTELYDPVAQTFVESGDMMVPRESHAAVRLQDGHVLVAGGHRGRRANIELFASAEMYNPETGTFSAAGEMTIRRHKHDAILLPDDRVLITGGSDERDNRGSYKSAEIYNPETGAFTRISDMQMPHYKHQGTSIVLSDGQVLIAGGSTHAELFDPAQNTFQLVKGEKSMAGQFSASALLSDGSVLITGGYGDGTGPRSSAWMYRQ